MAIGLAAEQLFQALPKAERARLAELPAVVRQLEGHATTIRGRVAELDALLASARAPQQPSSTLGARGAAGVDAHRDEVSAELRAARDLAAGRLEQTVAALETIRLDLLRLQGGVGDVGRLTTALEAARALDEDVRRLVTGHDAAGELLDAARRLPSPPDPVGAGSR
jgi:hypothetical protein